MKRRGLASKRERSADKKEGVANSKEVLASKGGRGIYRNFFIVDFQRS